MDPDQAAAWNAIRRGEGQLTWDLWSAAIESSTVLTTAGKLAVRDAVNAVAQHLGEDWFARFLPNATLRSSASRSELPLLSLLWWPNNDVPHVHIRVLQLGCRIRLLAGISGFADVRRNMRQDLGQFAHSLLQLEVGSLAMRSGWAVWFEPPAGDSGSRTDLRLVHGHDAMLVEVKGFLLDQQSTEDLAVSRRISNALVEIEIRFDVTFDGEFEPGMDEEAANAWLKTLESLAATVQRTGLAIATAPPSGGRFVIQPGWPTPGAGHTTTIRHGDEWQRIVRAIEAKAEQARGDDPLWLRFDESPEFWALAVAPDYPRTRLHQRLAAGLSAELARFDHVAGIVLSGSPHVGSTLGVDASWESLPGQGTSVVSATQAGFRRETIIVSRPDAIAARHRAQWSSWYADEGSWLSWALDRLDIAPLAELIRPPTQPPWPLSSPTS